MIETNRDGDTVTIRLAHGKASALDLELLRAITEVTREVAASDARAAVLTGTDSIFSAGVDLKRLLDGGDAYLDEFLPALDEAFQALFFFPKPLVVACNGHAIAGGCVMLACGDVRIGAEGRGTIGAPELRVGVPFPITALEILRHALPADSVQRVTLTGDVYSMEDALAMGLVERVVPGDRLVDEALEAAALLASYPAAAFSDTKARLRAPAAEALAREGEAHAKVVRDLWGSADVRGAVQSYVDRMLRR